MSKEWTTVKLRMTSKKIRILSKIKRSIKELFKN